MSESVWDYPRPPRVEASARRIRIVCGGVTIVDTTNAIRVLETSHPPVFYVPPADVAPAVLRPIAHRTFCEFKGVASYWDVTAGGRHVPAAGWSYPDPSPGYETLRDHLAFYPSKMDACFVDDEQVTPQEGDFYGGWITSEVTGPFKGGPGTRGW
jgi:uncharacterized protein (DUF427 family)